MYANHLSNLGRPPVPSYLCKNSAQDILGSGEEEFQRFLPYMGMGPS